jgi:hypothetical protein
MRSSGGELWQDRPYALNLADCAPARVSQCPTIVAPRAGRPARSTCEVSRGEDREVESATTVGQDPQLFALATRVDSKRPSYAIPCSGGSALLTGAVQTINL